MTQSNPKPVEGARNAGLEEAAQICESWGDQCAGGSGREIVPSGPNKGQMYGQAYYNLAESIRCAMKPVEAAFSAAPAPTIDEKRQSMLSERDRGAREKVLNALDRAVRHDDVNVTVMTQDLYATMNAASEAAAPARDGVREAALEEAAKLIVAKAATQYGNLSVRQVQELVQEIRALTLGAAKEQADGQ